MTRHSIEELAAAIRQRYGRATKEGKGRILDEFTKSTDLHRKAAIRLINRVTEPSRKRKAGRHSRYDSRVVGSLKAVWEASNRLCSKRLKPFMPEILEALRRHGELAINAEVERKLCSMSAATIDRLLKQYRPAGIRHGLSTTRAGILKNMIPIRTFTDWKEDAPGFLEVDLVAHCGESVEGFYLNTLCAVDVYSGWTECLPVWGKGQMRVRSAVHRVRSRLPFPLLGVDSDNGSEFINQYLYAYCQQARITFTRSRSYKKNDSCHVEQKNGNVVRKIVGYDRYSSRAAYECLDRIYSLVRHYQNFFQPTMKLLSKARHGARVYKLYETAQTPYQRLLKTGNLSAESQAELAVSYAGLNPVLLLNQISTNLEQLWRLKDRSYLGNRNYEATSKASVTV